MKHTKLILFCSLMLSGCQEVILHELNEGQANRALVILAREGLPAEKLREGAGWSIAVAKDKVTASLDVLEESRGLKELTERQSSSNSSLVQSREERQQQVEKELAERLEQTLESFPDVLEARVHLNLQSAKLSSLIAEKPKQSASVLILGRQGSVIEIAPIQRLISGASGVIDSAVTVLVKENKQNSSVQSRKVTPRAKCKRRVAAPSSVYLGRSLSPAGPVVFDLLASSPASATRQLIKAVFGVPKHAED